MISQTAEYALRAVVDLAYHSGECRTTRQIAAATRVPTGYLAKILQDLSRHGLVRSQRGLHGGFTIDGPIEDISVYDVLVAVDPPKRIRQCPLGLAAHASRLCPLHQRLDDAMALIERSFRACSIADVTSNPGNQPLRGKRAELTFSGGLSNRPGRRRRGSKRKSGVGP